MKRFICLCLIILSSLFLYSCTGEESGVVNSNAYTDFDAEESLYTICFKQKDGRILSNQIVKHNDSIILPDDPAMNATAKYTYTFIGWDYNNDGSVDDIPAKASYSFIAVAVYEQTIRSYQVEFRVEIEDYEGNLVQTINYGTSATPPDNLVKEGYVFKGWDNAIDYITGDVIATAIWARIQYSILLDSGSERLFEGKISKLNHVVHDQEENLLPCPTLPLNFQKLFTGYVNEQGELITDSCGRVTYGYSFTDGEVLTATYESVNNGATYFHSYFPTSLVSDETLIQRLEGLVPNENGYVFYRGNHYYKYEQLDETYKTEKGLSTYYFQMEIIEFTYLYNLYGSFIENSMNYDGAMVSKDVLLYGTKEEVEVLISVFEDFILSPVMPSFGINYSSGTGTYLPGLIDTNMSPVLQFYEDDTNQKFASTDFAKALGYDGSDYMFNYSSRDSTLYMNSIQGGVTKVNDTNKHGYRLTLTILVY